MTDDPYFDDDLGVTVVPEGSQAQKDAEAVFERTMEDFRDAVDTEALIEAQQRFKETMGIQSQESADELAADIGLIRAWLGKMLDDAKDMDDVPAAMEEILETVLLQLAQDGASEIAKQLGEEDDERVIGTRFSAVKQVTELLEEGDDAP